MRLGMALPTYLVVSEATPGGHIAIFMVKSSPTSRRTGCPCPCCILGIGTGLCTPETCLCLGQSRLAQARAGLGTREGPGI